MDVGELTFIASLIEKHLTGSLSEGERITLEIWLKDSEEHQKIFNRICSEKFLEQWRAEEMLFDAESASHDFIKKTFKDSKQAIRQWWKYAAAIVVLLIGTTILLYKHAPEEEVPLLQRVGGSMARLTLENGQTIELSGTMSDTLLQGNVSLYASGDKLEYQAINNSSVYAVNVLEVPRKGEFFLQLSDGTKVWLNSETRLCYPVVFTGKERSIRMEGEIYLEVQKDTCRPFIVDMPGRGRVEVTGTSFNVRNYRDEENVQVTLVEGGVRIASVIGKKIGLQPGEQGRITSENHVGKQNVNVSIYTAWREGRFVFKEQPLEEILKTISRWYDVEVIFEDEKVKKATFSGNLKRYDDFGKIIGMLESIRIARFKLEENCIRVYAYKNAD